VKKLVKFFLIGFVILGLVIGMSTTPNVEADFCEFPPEGQPLPENCNVLP